MIVKVVHADPTLPHQLVLGLGRSAGEVDISCNCLALTSKGGHKPMGTVSYSKGLDAIWEIYDDPFKHDNRGRVNFVPGDRGPGAWEIVW